MPRWNSHFPLPFFFFVLCAFVLCIPCLAGDPSAVERFDGQVAPLLARRCLGCHNASDLKGELDLTRKEKVLAEGGPVVPGKPDESLLWQMVEGDQMPPKKPLTESEKKILVDWIQNGAVWGTSPIDVFAFSSDVRREKIGGRCSRSAPWNLPEFATRPGLQPIDRFILATLEANGLSPSPPADRRTLLRRITLDLTGLPPTPEEVEQFCNNNDPRAYAKLVDRLLASPAYGERWARHWLDLARFGESNGFEYDEPRANAWPYRDWVIDAFHQDMPYDEFVRRQVAGDVLFPEDPKGVVATGFLTAGAYDTAGQKQQSDAMKAVVRQDELEDIVATVGQTFLGLTVNCARCHDHKFDPILQEEYYRLTAALGGVRHGEKEITSTQEKVDYAKAVTLAQVRKGGLRAALEAIDAPVRKQLLAEQGTKDKDPPSPAPPAPIAEWSFDKDYRDGIGELHGTPQGNAALKDGKLVLDGRDSYVLTQPLATNLYAKTLEVFVSLARLQQSGGGAMSIQTMGGGVFDGIVFAEREPGQWMAGSDNFHRTQSCSGPMEREADGKTVHVAIVYGEDGVVTAYRDGQPYGKSYRTGGPALFKAGDTQVVFGMRHGPPGGNKMLAGAIELARLYDRALTAEEIAASARTVAPSIREARIIARLSKESALERSRIQEEIRRLDDLQKSPPRRLCYGVLPQQPGPTHVLLRGDTRSPAALVVAGGISSLRGVRSDFGLADNAPEGERRRALAEWISSENNPLFARVIVNRLWHYHFGVGIVDTPNDFGFNGGRPSHPELLDWLAKRLIEKNWSLKQLHREIVLSATYQQASTLNESARKKDADNRLLWRKSPQRLEAETLRDSILFVAGELNFQRGGPSFRDCQEILRSGTHTYVPADPVGPEFQRRSIYRAWIRGGRSNLLDAFDCPDPSTTTPRRAVTTTPQQALSLQNSSFVLRMSDLFASRVRKDVGEHVDAQVERAYLVAYGRLPTEHEHHIAMAVVRDHGLAVLTRAIFNSNEFLYVD
ncbi:MAG: DUF1553 domain-containing protein [Planctomycetota bacterium]